MATIREYLTTRLTKAQELAQYSECVISEKIVLEPQRNAWVLSPVQFLVQEKLVSYNGQEKIIAQRTEIKHLYVPHEAPSPVGQSSTIPYPSKFVDVVINPLDALINEIEPILNKISQISSYRSNKESYISNNVRINTEISTIEQQFVSSTNKINILGPEVNRFNIKDNLNKITPEQRSHILIKIWNSTDDESNSIKVAIKECGFNPNYVDKDGKSLIGMALTSKDDSFFDLLMANKIDFNSHIDNKIVSQLILESANQSFIAKMFADKPDLSKSILTLALKDDVNSLAVILGHNPKLTETIYSSDSLLLLALKNGCYKSAEQIIKSNPDTMRQVFKTGVTEYEYSVLSIMVLTGNKTGVKLLKVYGASLATEVENAVARGYTKYITKLLKLYPDMVNETFGGNGNTLLHLACKNGNKELVEMILQKDLSYLNEQNNEGQTALHILCESNMDIAVKIQIARTILKLHPDLSLKDIHAHTPVDLAYNNAEFLSVFEELGLLGLDKEH